LRGIERRMPCAISPLPLLRRQFCSPRWHFLISPEPPMWRRHLLATGRHRPAMIFHPTVQRHRESTRFRHPSMDRPRPLDRKQTMCRRPSMDRPRPLDRKQTMCRRPSMDRPRPLDRKLTKGRRPSTARRQGLMHHLHTESRIPPRRRAPTSDLQWRCGPGRPRGTALISSAFSRQVAEPDQILFLLLVARL
jgi:hypothetical protein